MKWTYALQAQNDTRSIKIDNLSITIITKNISKGSKRDTSKEVVKWTAFWELLGRVIHQTAENPVIYKCIKHIDICSKI